MQVVTPAVQRPIASLHVSTPLHITPSEQLRGAAPVHAALALHVSPSVQKSPSSHAMPVRADHAFGVAARQTWHWFVGFTLSGA